MHCFRRLEVSLQHRVCYKPFGGVLGIFWKVTFMTKTFVNIQLDHLTLELARYSTAVEMFP